MRCVGCDAPIWAGLYCQECLRAAEQIEREGRDPAWREASEAFFRPLVDADGMAVVRAYWDAHATEEEA